MSSLGRAGKAVIDQDEVHYLCEQASRYLKEPVKPSDVVWTFSRAPCWMTKAATPPL